VNPARAWGGTPSATPQRISSKRANSPQGYEASCDSNLSGFFDSLCRRSPAGFNAELPTPVPPPKTKASKQPEGRKSLINRIAFMRRAALLLGHS